MSCKNTGTKQSGTGKKDERLQLLTSYKWQAELSKWISIIFTFTINFRVNEQNHPYSHFLCAYVQCCISESLFRLSAV